MSVITTAEALSLSLSTVRTLFTFQEPSLSLHDIGRPRHQIETSIGLRDHSSNHRTVVSIEESGKGPGRWKYLYPRTKPCREDGEIRKSDACTLSQLRYDRDSASAAWASWAKPRAENAGSDK